jgi:hypothetical protein
VSSRDDLVARAQERAEAPPTPAEWGYRVALNESESFTARWRGETTDPDNDDRRVFLFWDDAGEPCFHRYYAALGREVDRVNPKVGDIIAIFRGDNYKSQFDDPGEETGQSYGLEAEPSSDPLPGEPPAATEAPAKSSGQLADDEEFPY